MERGERFYLIHRELKSGKCISLNVFTKALSISSATFKRDIEYLRDRYGAPIAWDRDRRGYFYDLNQDGADRFDLPGLWFSASEVHALLVVQAMLHKLGSGLIAPHIAPLTKRLESLLDDGAYAAAEVRRRIRIEGVGARKSDSEFFAICAQGVLQRRRVLLQHYHRQRDELTQREVSPQRLVYYRENWYLDTWCHMRNALRSFSLDSLRAAELLEKTCEEVSDQALDAHLASGYGIFPGPATKVARLRFSAIRSRWVRNEVWHPAQVSWFEEAGGRYVLEVPYGDDRELVMDILRYGSDVEVEGPESLRTRVAEELERARAHYR